MLGERSFCPLDSPAFELVEINARWTFCSQRKSWAGPDSFLAVGLELNNRLFCVPPNCGVSTFVAHLAHPARSGICFNVHLAWLCTLDSPLQRQG